MPGEVGCKSAGTGRGPSHGVHEPRPRTPGGTVGSVLDDLLEAWRIHGVRQPQEVSYGTWGYWGGYELKEPAG